MGLMPFCERPSWKEQVGRWKFYKYVHSLSDILLSCNRYIEGVEWRRVVERGISFHILSGNNWYLPYTIKEEVGFISSLLLSYMKKCLWKDTQENDNVKT